MQVVNENLVFEPTVCSSNVVNFKRKFLSGSGFVFGSLTLLAGTVHFHLHHSDGQIWEDTSNMAQWFDWVMEVEAHRAGSLCYFNEYKRQKYEPIQLVIGEVNFIEEICSVVLIMWSIVRFENVKNVHWGSSLVYLQRGKCLPYLFF